MPTGYTAKLMEQGQPFNEFVMQCARAMGACIMMRDEPFSTPISEKFEPSDYNNRKLSEAKLELARLLAMTSDEKIALGVAERDSEIARRNEYLLRETEQNQRLIDMERKVKEWVPPSNDHKHFKDFMLDQIRISKHDLSYMQTELSKSHSRSPVSYYSDAVMKAERDIDYHTSGHAEEVERTNGRNNWIRLLRESLT
jgi:hypothetical protein